MSKESIKNLKSGNYEVVDSQGVSVTTHFIECLQKEFADLEAKLAESEKEIASLEVCLLENKNNMKEMQGFKIGEDEYDLTDEDARNDLRDYIQEFEKVSKRIYEQKEYAEKILRMSTHEEHQEILQLKQRLAEKDGELHQIYSHLGVEAFGEDIHEQALKEIANRENQYNQLIFKSKYTNEEMIDFAVEQLEDVKDEVEYGVKIWTSIDNYGDKVVNYSDLLEFIDQQIKELKGEK